MTTRSRLEPMAETLYWAALVLSVVLPLLALLAAARGVMAPASLLPDPAGAAVPVSRAQAGLVAVLIVIAVLPLVAALRAMARLFDAYRQGEVFTPDNAALIRAIGRALLAGAILTVLVPAARALVLGWHAPDRSFPLALDGGTLGFLLAAGFVTAIGHAMDEAARLKAENAGFV